MLRNRNRFFLLTALLFLTAVPLSAGAGFWNTLFGSGDQEFICYSRIHRNFYLGIFGAVCGLGFIAWSRYRLKKRTAEKLETQKNIIEEQNKDILASIRYARRMQEAQRPDKELVRSLLPESFFFLRPRDIVSGDFYFVEEWNGKAVIAAVDCTGHGVPGAFLTFIGNQALHHALENVGADDPSKLLDTMNAEVKRALGQQRPENELNDGMEVALCIFDPASRTLDYAGAGSPLFVVRNGETEEVKAAKCTVGSIQAHVTEPPPRHTFRLAAGDGFYLASDGMADQFGGPEGKKFRKEQVRNLIREIHPLSSEAQLQRVEATIAAWMKGHSQTDDMMLLGVKV